MPYIVTTKGHIGYWELTGKTYYKWRGMTRSVAYEDRGHILPIFTHYYGHVAEIKYICGWDYTGKYGQNQMIVMDNIRCMKFIQPMINNMVHKQV